MEFSKSSSHPVDRITPFMQPTDQDPPPLKAISGTMEGPSPHFVINNPANIPRRASKYNTTVILDLQSLVHVNYIRPYTFIFLQSLTKIYNHQGKRVVEVILWSTSEEEYVKRCAKTLDPSGEIFDYLICWDQSWVKQCGIKDVSSLSAFHPILFDPNNASPLYNPVIGSCLAAAYRDLSPDQPVPFCTFQPTTSSSVAPTGRGTLLVCPVMSPQRDHYHAQSAPSRVSHPIKDLEEKKKSGAPWVSPSCPILLRDWGGRFGTCIIVDVNPYTAIYNGNNVLLVSCFHSDYSYDTTLLYLLQVITRATHCTTNSKRAACEVNASFPIGLPLIGRSSLRSRLANVEETKDSDDKTTKLPLLTILQGLLGGGQRPEWRHIPLLAWVSNQEIHHTDVLDCEKRWRIAAETSDFIGDHPFVAFLDENAPYFYLDVAEKTVLEERIHLFRQERQTDYKVITALGSTDFNGNPISTQASSTY